VARNKQKAEPWYEDGLTFRCTACGQCCTGEPGNVWVTPEEIRGLARARGMSTRAFKKTFVNRVGRRLSLKEKENGDCAMLENGKCSVYDAKPQRCTTFPFWKQVMSYEREWIETAESCEGIGQGDRYSREEIEQIVGGDPTPLLEKHKRPPETPVVSRFDENGKPKPVDATSESETSDIDWTTAFEALGDLYAQLDRELPRYEFTCSASGNCCDFDAFGHRLYVTTLEAEYFFRNSAEERSNDDARACPAWGDDRLCKSREGRMLGCRTFFCGPYPVEEPEALHERYLAQVTKLHERFGIPYAYRDITDWAAERRPAG